MPSFLLRDLDPIFWSKVQAKAKAEGVTVKALILRLLATWLAAILVLTFGAGCAYHNPSAPSATTTPPVNLTPASIRLNVASRTDHQLDVSAEVLSADGHPVPDVPLDFAIVDGTVNPSAATTDATGYARTIAALSSATTLTVSGAGIAASLRLEGTSVPAPATAFNVVINATGATAGTASSFGVSTQMAVTRADWTFGDSGTGSTATGFTTHMYGRSGVYAVGVTVTDAAGHSASATGSVAVSAAPVDPPAPALALTVGLTCTANPHGTPTACNVTVSYGTTLVATAVTNVLWNWGDGLTDTTAGPVMTHSYASAGTYTVFATVTAALPMPPGGPGGQATTMVTKIVTIP